MRDAKGERKTRRDGVESREHRKTQRGTCRWEPERNRSTYIGRMRSSMTPASAASSVVRSQADFACL